MARTKQDYETPPEFFAACEKRFGQFSCDLAAHEGNYKVNNYIAAEQDTFNVKWHKIGGLLWLNSEFDRLDLYAAKCMREAKQGARIIQLCPASISTEWYADCALNFAHTIAIRPRLTFVGCKDPYPKDLMLLLWGMSYKVSWAFTSSGNDEFYNAPGQISAWRWQ